MDNNDYQIRMANMNDIADVYKHMLALYESQRVHYESSKTPDPSRLREIAEARIRSKTNVVFLLERSDSILGIIVGQISKFDSRFPTYSDVVGIVSEIYLVQEVRGGDFAELLYDKLEEWFRAGGVNSVIADFFVGNVHSRRFFGRIGFSPLSERVYKEL